VRPTFHIATPDAGLRHVREIDWRPPAVQYLQSVGRTKGPGESAACVRDDGMPVRRGVRYLTVIFQGPTAWTSKN
jgi:hypothetical protein